MSAREKERERVCVCGCVCLCLFTSITMLLISLACHLNLLCAVQLMFASINYCFLFLLKSASCTIYITLFLFG